MAGAQTMQVCRVNGVQLEYEVFGQGEPVLLVSPVLADGFIPLFSQPVLTRRYQLIRYHKRGWCGSTHTPPPVAVTDHVADAAALLTHVGARRAHVVGHSTGAAVAFELAIRYPMLVHTVTSLEMSLLSVPSAGAFFEKVGPAFEAYAAGRHEEALAVFLAEVSGMDWDACRALLERRVPGIIAAALKDADTFFGIELPALREWHFTAADAARVAQPVLSVTGSQTKPLWFEVAQFLRQSVHHVEECTIDGAGHLLQLQNPEPVARGLAEFLSRHPFQASNG